MARTAPEMNVSECRQCCSFCDRVVHPAGCIAAGCPYLYLYDDEDTGSRFMGCMQKVFSVEIDEGIFREADRTRLGYGGVKMTGRPLAQCVVGVEQAYAGRGEPFACVNPGFFDKPTRDDDDESAAFDLRDRL